MAGSASTITVMLQDLVRLQRELHLQLLKTQLEMAVAGEHPLEAQFFGASAEHMRGNAERNEFLLKTLQRVGKE
jgi:hypothetical protein